MRNYLIFYQKNSIKLLEQKKSFFRQYTTVENYDRDKTMLKN